MPARRPGPTLWRMKTPDGWVVADDAGIAIVRDPEHAWAPEMTP